MGVRLAIEAVHPDGTTSRSDVELDQPRIAVGRAASSDVLLPHPSVSSLHATLRVSGTGYAVVDERSTNGTEVEGQRIVAERPRTLRNGDVIAIGPFRLRVSLGAATQGLSGDSTVAGRRLLPPAPRSIGIRTRGGAPAMLELPAAAVGLVVGRADDAFVRLDDAECSRVHAYLDVSEDEVVIRDAESKNGLLVNGRAVTRRALRDGDTVALGESTLVFVDPRDSAIRAIASADDDAPYEAVAPAAAVAEDDAPDDAVPLVGVDLFEAPADDARPESPAAPMKRKAEPKRSSPNAVADRLAFGLAIVVLALSVAAFVWLFRES